MNFYNGNVFLTSSDAPIENEVTQEVSKVMQILRHIGNECLDLVDAYWMKIVGAILVYFIGKKVVAFLSKIIERGLERSSIELSVCKFLNRLIIVILNIVLIISVMGCLGIQTTSFVALVGSAGLAVGLSLQGSLANFAGGVLILLLKPFKVNDFIISNGVEGVVKTIDIFYTKIITGDNKKIVIPNGTLANSVIQTVPEVAKRRVDLFIPVEYSADIKKVKAVLMKIAENNEKVKQSSGIEVFVQSLDASSISIGFRTWVATADYYSARSELLESVIYKFREEDITIPFDQLYVNLVNDDKNIKIDLKKENG